MAYQTKNNSGAMFLNDRKTKENQPDYTGKVIVDNKIYYVSCWVKEPNDPDKKNYLSLAFSIPKKAQPQEVGKATGQPTQTEPEQEQTPVTEGLAEEIVEVEEEDTEIPF